MIKRFTMNPRGRDLIIGDTLDGDQQELAEALGLSRDCSMRDLISALKNFSLRVVDSGALDRAIRDLQALQVLVGKVAGTGETVPA